MKKQNRLDIKGYIPDSGFIGKYMKLIREKVIPFQYEVLSDNVEGAEPSHVISNFKNAAKALKGIKPDDDFYGMVFQDSDAAKWIEAASYSLVACPNAELEKTIDELIDIIVSAQDTDGYLDTYFTIKDKDKRWQNLMEAHELYCSGHMMEAACAYYNATGKDKLLNAMLKNAELIYEVFITDGHGGFPGHPEIELALLKMYETTGDEHCLKLAEYFINERGKDKEFYKKEAQKRDWTVWGNNTEDLNYSQCAMPVREQTEAVGHAVRAVYLYTGMAHLYSYLNDKSLFYACERLFDNIVSKKMYVTGGIGSTVIGEAFSVNYDLPSDSAYCETCASIGLIFFASRMLETDVNSKYSDIMERAFYNTVLASIGLDGKRFFYVNPLEALPGISGVSATRWHDLIQRPEWYACACCPPNAARLISSFGEYAYGENDTTVFCHLFASGTVSFKNASVIKCSTDYPYSFNIEYEVLEGNTQLAVRIPSWSKSFEVSVNGEMVSCNKIKGYVYINVFKGDNIKILLDDSPFLIYPNPKIPSLSGFTALCRGPLIYCFEGIDNENDVLSLALDESGKLSVGDFDEKFLGGTVVITADAYRTLTEDSLYSYKPPEYLKTKAKAVPYYTWSNRGENQMRVWMRSLGRGLSGK